MASTESPVADSATDPSFVLKVVSPSPGVVSPLSLEVKHNSTVKELKDKIRNMVESRPSDETIRLIYRGHYLDPDENMLGVFGNDQLSSGEPQSLHLVLRDPDANQSSANTLPPTNTGPSTTATAQTLPAAIGHVHYRLNLPSDNSIAPPFSPVAPIPLPHEIHQPEDVLPMPSDVQQAVDGLHNLSMGAQAQRQAQLQRLQHLQAEIMRLQTEVVSQQQRIQAMNAGMPRPFPTVSHPPFPPHAAQHHLDQAMLQLNYLQNQTAQTHSRPSSAVPERPHSAGPTPAQSLPIPGHVHAQLLHGPSGLHQQIHNHAVQQAQNGAMHGMPGVHQSPVSDHSIIDTNRDASLRVLQGQAFHNMVPNQTVRQEGVLPNGNRYSVTMSNVTTILPNAAAANLIPSRSTPAHSLATFQEGHNVVGLPGLPNLSPGRPSSSPGVGAANTNTIADINVDTSSATGLRQGAAPTVYLLSSPEGPRALLMHGGERYYTTTSATDAQGNAAAIYDGLYQDVSQNVAQIQAQSAILRARLNGLSNTATTNPPHVSQIGGVRNMGPVPHRRVGNPFNPPENNAAGVHQADQPAPNAGPRPGLNPPNPVLNGPVNAPAANADANARAPDAANRMMPHIWLLIRLCAFVWFFLSGNSSWSRWITLIGVAAAIFLYNTGLLNETAERLWAPARRHLDVLLPLAPPAHADAPAQGVNVPAAEQNVEVQRRVTEPSPDQVAARLIEQRRQADRSWLATQFRRLEHAALLFMATLVPGVGERHIMARMEQEGAQLEAARVAREAQTQAQAAIAEPANIPIDANTGTEEQGSTDTQPVSATSTAVEPAHEDVAEVRQRHAQSVESSAA